jgi:hypothetical protein
MDRSSRSLALTLALVGNLGGCASAQNTPQRDYVREMVPRSRRRGHA